MLNFLFGLACGEILMLFTVMILRWIQERDNERTSAFKNYKDYIEHKEGKR